MPTGHLLDPELQIIIDLAPVCAFTSENLA